MKTLLLISILFSSLSYAAGEGWYCEKVASAWLEQGRILSACGIGTGEDENEARLDAYLNAKKEFEAVCNKDTTCANKVVNIDPKRTDCVQKGGQFVCHRLFNYYITDTERKPALPEKGPEQEVKRITTKVIHEKTEYTTNNYINQYITQPVIKETRVVDPNGNKVEEKSYRCFWGGFSVRDLNSDSLLLIQDLLSFPLTAQSLHP